MMSQDSDYDILIAIPCYRESRRLPAFLEELCRTTEASPLSACIQIVDDGSGSTERTRLGEIVSGLQSRWACLIDPIYLSRNLGKGGAIKAAWSAAPATIAWMAFVDADGSANAETTLSFLAQATSSEAGLAIATRRGGSGETRVQRDLSRAWAASWFNRLIRWRYEIESLDTQCGLKAISSDAFRELSADLRQNRFGFDLELIAAARAAALPFREIPIDWTEIPGSRVTLSDALGFAWKVLTRQI